MVKHAYRVGYAATGILAQRRIEQAAAQPMLLAPERVTAEQISFDS